MKNKKNSPKKKPVRAPDWKRIASTMTRMMSKRWGPFNRACTCDVCEVQRVYWDARAAERAAHGGAR